MRLQIDCIEWVLEKIEVNKVPNDRLDGLIQKMVKDLEKRKDKALKRPEDHLCHSLYRYRRFISLLKLNNAN